MLPFFTPTQAVILVPSPSPTRIVGIIPGLAPADVKVNLQNRQFNCTSAEEVKGEGYYIWRCEKKTASVNWTVIYYARTLGTVDSIDATIMQFGQPDDSLSVSFLSFVATMPYSQSEPDKARAWIEKTLPTIKKSGDVRTTKIGDVQFQLFGPPTGRTLSMGDVAK